MKILQYRGKSWVSRLIKLQTRSPYSHTAILLDNNTVIEAWYKGGVAHNESISTVHTPGTLVDFFEITGDIDTAAAEAFAQAQVGKGYDRGAIARFITRRDEPADDLWICSELAAAVCAAGQLLLLSPSTPHSHLSPRDISLSPFLEYSHTAFTA